MTSCVPSGTDQSSRARPPLVGVAGNAGIGDRHIMAFGTKRRLQLVGKALARPKAKARHQAVTEADDLERLGMRRRNGAANSEEKDEAAANGV